ncbi:MAG: AraC family transcriptional regulator [Kofleriaceae bacterium]
MSVSLLVGTDRIGLAGDLGNVSTHRHATAAVVVGLDGPLRYVAPYDGREHESRAALLAPGFAHAVDVRGGRMAVFLLPPGAVAASALHRSVTDLDEGEWVELGEQLGPDFEHVDRALARVRARARPIDDRLAKATGILADRLLENVPAEELAAAVGLSTSRLMTFAREQLGTSLRVYRRWLRTFRVARDYASGASLTRAAIDAGFSSSAHLSAAAREHFGVAPSQILSPENRSRIIVL